MKYPKAAKDWLAFLGSKGGKANTAAQQAARAENGKKGGRPPKKVKA